MNFKMNGRVKLILYVIVVANIASSENVKSFKYVKGESQGYTNSSKDQELKLKGTLIPLDDKNLGRKRTGFDEAFERNMESSVHLKKQTEGHDFNSRQINNYNNKESDIYKSNIDSSVYWGNQHKNDEHTLRKTSEYKEHENERNADELRKGYNWASEKDMTFIRDSNIYSNDYKTNRPNLNIDVQTRPKPDWETFNERQSPSLGNQNSKHFADPYSDLRNPYKYARREYLTDVNNREMRNQNIYNVDSELANTQSRYPVHRIFDFNDENKNMQHSNFYKTDKGLVINLKTECPRESKHGIVHKIFFSTEPHLNSFAESSASYIPGTTLIPSNHMTNPIYYL